MFHVVTVHWQDDRWIEPQVRYLRKNLAGPIRLYASLNGVDPAWADRFDFAEALEGSHPEKLNALADVVARSARPEDFLVFIDGDAFPIAAIDESILAGTPLAAVRRDENLGDRQPHPCFCLTTVGFWQAIGGDWRPGHRWAIENGATITDVGGNLLGILEQRGIQWRPLLRSNAVDLDPIWFAVYGQAVYHHGAGFRKWRLSRAVALENAASPRLAVQSAKTPPWVPVLGRLERSARYRRAKRRRARFIAQHAAAEEALSAEVCDWIAQDEEFYRRFLEPGYSPGRPSAATARSAGTSAAVEHS